ncbi:MAG TPA: RNA 2',3'-cyclic phosphodiesterase [Gammaproteobacteria bacterium]|nr:RNA 2',3'-cyclic phosphodiesterase [Gammaproteobacteria bacterium]
MARSQGAEILMQSSSNCEASKIRVFVGLQTLAGDWLAPVRQSLYEESYPGIESLRLTPERNLHVTLKFLGLMAEEAIPELSLHLAQVCAKHQVFNYHCRGLGHFKQSIWLGVDPSPELLALSKDIENCCALLGFAAEQKRFTPHVTIARYGKAARPPLSNLTDRFGEQEWFVGAISEACLFKSETLPAGAKYTVIERYPLKP